MYSLLVVADYYATTEFMNGARMLDFGEIVDYEDMIDIYESGDVQKKMRHIRWRRKNLKKLMKSIF